MSKNKKQHTFRIEESVSKKLVEFTKGRKVSISFFVSSLVKTAMKYSLVKAAKKVSSPKSVRTPASSNGFSSNPVSKKKIVKSKSKKKCS